MGGSQCGDLVAHEFQLFWGKLLVLQNALEV